MLTQFGVRHTSKQPHGSVPASNDNTVCDIDADSRILLWRVLVCAVDVRAQPK
jgi:hypothetical protein